MAKNVYIHIPFCKSKCKYCSFVSYDKLESKDDYIESLCSQIREEYKGERLNTLYFGGGTPSLLSLEDFKLLLGLFSIDKSSEITVEINPDSVDFTYLKGLNALGVNRISIGSQTFDDETLKLIGRIHDSVQIVKAVDLAKKAGFDNISLDLIYGLPNQSLSDFEIDLNIAIKLDVQHISLYGLKIEEGCYFYKNMPNRLPDLDLQADMYLKAIELLLNAGFEHYEISNFSKVNYNSRHNLNYWDNNTYYGFGCSASGYIDGARYTNEADLQKYIINPFSKVDKHDLSKQETLEEAIFLGFRKLEGINISKINGDFGIDFNQKYSKVMDKYRKYFRKTNDGWALTIEGILISNEILSEFIL